MTRIWHYGMGTVVLIALTADVSAPALAQQPPQGAPTAGTWMYLRPQAGLRAGPNLTDPIVVRPSQWLPIQAVEPCDFWNCRVTQDSADRQVLFARRSRVELAAPPGVTVGADGRPIVSNPPSAGSGTSPTGRPPIGGERPKLVRGDEGEDVRAVQEWLVRRGYQIKVDGKFGSGTERAVREFQRSNGLSPDGRVGPLTRQRLRA